ncbi:PAS domain-containing sensor histidine kinase [Bacteriovoracaceae bacterium]|nr:PAS domain-containing sensor histidine kinase [Bacteriovoracaceae bacterium]
MPRVEVLIAKIFASFDTEVLAINSSDYSVVYRNDNFLETFSQEKSFSSLLDFLSEEKKSELEQLNSKESQNSETPLSKFSFEYKNYKFSLFKTNIDNESFLIATRTEIKSSEDSIKLVESILDSLPGGVFCKEYSTSPGRFVYWNKSAEVLWGLKKDEVIGMSDFDFFPDNEAKLFQDADLKTIRDEKEIFIEQEQVTSPTLGERLVKTWKVPLIVGERKYLLGVSHDITEKVKLEGNLEKEKARAFNASRLASITETCVGIAHEVNNPLAIIQGFNRKIQKNAEKQEDENTIKITEKIEENVKRISSVINGMKKLSRDASNDPFENKSIAEIVEEVKNLTATKSKITGVEITFDYNEHQETVVECRQYQIVQALVNLVQNAIYVSEEKGDMWVNFVVEQSSDKVSFRIVDPGIGIPEQILNKIFNPFFTTKEIGQGTGLGLSISRSMVEQHGGKLDYSLHDGHTSFIITLPLNQAASAA